MATVKQANIAVGNFFFRHRNTLFPILFVSSILSARPYIIGNPIVDRLLVVCGSLIACAGQAVRLLTIGYEYIERGGKAGKVYASHLVQGRVYALTRNPMYLGNGLIAVGATMVAGAPVVYAIVLPFFLFVYQALIAAEEVYLHSRFGKEYEQYCRSVNRLWPAVSRAQEVLAGLSYDWKRAIRKDLSTLTGLATSLMALRVWRLFWLQGWAEVKAVMPGAAAWMAAVLLLYSFAWYLKKERRFFY